jgi:hypothetical protein
MEVTFFFQNYFKINLANLYIIAEKLLNY